MCLCAGRPPAAPRIVHFTEEREDGRMTKLPGQQIADEGLTDWAYLLFGLQTRVHTENFATGLAIVNAIGAAAEQLNHHPDLTLSHDHVDIRLTTHDERGVTALDVQLARAIIRIAGDIPLDSG